MPTFKVYLDPKKNHKDGVYAYSTTLVVADAGTAAADAFAAWRAEPRSTAPATLADCVQSVKQV